MHRQNNDFGTLKEASYLKKKKDEITIRSSAAEYLTYVASVGDQQDSIEMRYEDENIWLTQKMMATLYDVGLPTINEHIKKIYADSELEESATIRNFRIVQTEGSRQVTRDTKHYNLQMIIAVGFKVNNERAVQFRKWANGIVKDYTIKGWVMDDERLKNGGSVLTVEYFDRLLDKLKKKGKMEQYNKIEAIWENIMDKIDGEAKTYKAAITEHFYDNAGFGPTAGALCESGRIESAKKYGALLLANIGYSNDFRAQNPDRWWEALTYMIHSLWGGITAASAYKVFEKLKDTRYLEASYRATAGILYCYDTHSTATSPLAKGMAASTYAVAGPHINRPDLSRDRFGQSTFYRDGGIFAKLFDNDSQTPDWDMGEELVAYLENFGDKAFIIKKGTSILVINGSFEETDTEYKITSFAPYSRGFYFISDGDIIELANEKGLQKITLKKERV